MNSSGDIDDFSFNLDESETHSRQLYNLMKRGVFCDALLRLTEDGSTLPVHRVVLASGSQFFRALFTYDMKNFPEQCEVRISGVSKQTMESILEYMYLRKVSIHEDNFEDIFLAADRFLIFGLQKMTCDFLLNQMSIDNCLGIYNFLESKGSISSFKHVKSYILQHFDNVAMMSKEFLQLSVESLTDLLTNDELQTANESEVYKAIRRWLEFDPLRIAFTEELYRCIRLSFMDQEFLELQCTEDVILLSSCMEQRIIRRETRNRKKTDLLHFSSIDPNKYILRPRVPNFVLFVMGGWSNKGVVPTAETYDINVNHWFDFEYSMPHPRSYHSTLPFRDQIFIVGGFDGQRYLSSMYSFHTKTKTWSAKNPMYSRRCYVAAVVLSDQIYACGGFDGVNRLDAVERFDPSSNQWLQLPPMSHRRSDAGAAALNGKLYIAGGFDGHTCLRTVEMFDPEKNQWTAISQLLSRRSGVCLVHLNESIVALGGYDGNSRLCTAEQYQSERNAWAAIPDMNLGRSNFAAATFGDKIFVVGGYDGSTTSDSVEMYDGQKKCWIKIADLPTGKSALSACILHSFDRAKDFTFHGHYYQTAAIGSLPCDDYP